MTHKQPPQEVAAIYTRDRAALFSLLMGRKITDTFDKESRFEFVKDLINGLKICRQYERSTIFKEDDVMAFVTIGVIDYYVCVPMVPREHKHNAIQAMKRVAHLLTTYRIDPDDEENN